MVEFSEDQSNQAKLKNGLELYLKKWVLYFLKKVIHSPSLRLREVKYLPQDAELRNGEQGFEPL